jgi:hypothetical protein
MRPKGILLPLHRPRGDVSILLYEPAHQERQVRILLVAKCDLKRMKPSERLRIDFGMINAKEK